MKAVYIKPYSGMSWLPPSNTLYGLIFTAMGLMKDYYNLEKLLQEFIERKPAFTLSDSFPFLDGKDMRTRYLPLPLSVRAGSTGFSPADIDAYRNFKLFRKNAYLKAEDFLDVCSGRTDPASYLASGRWKSQEGASPYVSDMMHNGIDRMNGSVTEGILFDHREISFKKNGGFYFLARGDSEIIKGALNYLSDFGIGGNNSTGKGQFSWSMEDASFIQEQNDGDTFVSLSRYLPDSDEIDRIRESDLTYYSVETMRGTLGTHFTGNARVWKKSVTVFRQGSVFPDTGKELYGRMAEVKDRSEGLPHPVYFTGYAFNFKMKRRVS